MLPFWGGARVVPSKVEFWQGRVNRLRDRFRCTREEGAEVEPVSGLYCILMFWFIDCFSDRLVKTGREYGGTSEWCRR